MDLSTCKALKILDKERGDNKNELCKLIVNVSPFDEIFTEMREKARVTENLKDVEGKLVALASSEAFKAATKLLSAEHTIADAMSTVTVVFEEFDLQCRDLQVTKVQSDHIMAGVTTILAALADLTLPVLDMLAIHVQTVEKDVAAALEATTATTSPKLSAWRLIKDYCPLGVGNIGVRQWLAIVNGVCSKVNMQSPNHFEAFSRYLSQSEVFMGLINATFELIGRVAEADADKTQVVGDACKAINEFQKSYDPKCDVLPLACSRVVLLALFELSLVV